MPTGEQEERGPRGPAGEDTVIRIDEVTKRFGATLAVDARFGIERGEFFSLLGPSGCGKTTTLRMIAGFELPTTGRILLDGADVSRVPPYKRNVNTVFQQYALFPHMTVFDNVAFGLRSRRVKDGDIRSRVAEMLEVVHLADFGARRPAQLSGGQQQRVALARALVNLPSALLLDEPLGALDLKLRQAMQLELKRIQQEVGITFVYVTHDQEEALTMSDSIAVMADGRVEQIGSPTDVYHRPATRFVAGFIGAANLLPVTVCGSADDEVTVRHGGQVFRAPANGSAMSEGDAATLMVRPERLQVTIHEPEPTGGRLDAVVAELVFQGPTVRCQVTTAEGREVVAHIGDDVELPLLRPGDHVWVSWARDACFVLPDVLPDTESPVRAVDESSEEPPADAPDQGESA